MTEANTQQTAEAPAKTGLKRTSRRTLIGVVKSIKMKKTITVIWERKVRHPRYHKYISRHTTLHAHDEKDEAKEGDLVEIMACRPLSKTKTWRLLRIVRRAHVEMPETGAKPAAAQA